jgi:non-ribosomal peptide synthetase component F
MQIYILDDAFSLHRWNRASFTSAARDSRGLFGPSGSDGGAFCAEVRSGMAKRLYRTGDLVRYLPDSNLGILVARVTR